MTYTSFQNPSSSFHLSEQGQKTLGFILSKYPKDRMASATLPMLDLVQRENGGWLSRDAMAFIAETLSLAYIRVYEVASFYTMYNLKPVGKFHLQLCRTTPCYLRGAQSVLEAITENLGIKAGQTTTDGLFTITEVECLGACVNAPVVQINDDYYEDLDAFSVVRILDALKRGEKPQHGSVLGRQGSKAMEDL